jgi:hypothetical protein
MPLKKIRLELARTADYPNGSANHGYEFVAPLDAAGHLDGEGWRKYANACTCRRFWPGEDDQHGTLMHKRGRWVFSYELGDDDDDTIFKFDRHNFVVGEYVSVTEHDGTTHPFKVVSVDAPTAFRR